MLKLENIRELAGGSSAEIYRATTTLPSGDTGDVVIRVCDSAELEFKLMTLLRRHAVAVPKVHHLELSDTQFAKPFFVIDYVDGVMALAPEDWGRFADQAADALLAVHGVDSAEIDYLPTLTEFWGEDVAATLPQFRASEITTALKSATLQRCNEPTLLHGDFWPGNVLWREGQIVSVIDWEDAVFGDPLIDLAIARLDQVWIFDWETMERFTERYRVAAGVDFGDLAYWELCAALRMARIIGQDIEGWIRYFEDYGRSDISVERFWQQYDRFIDHALARISQL